MLAIGASLLSFVWVAIATGWLLLPDSIVLTALISVDLLVLALGVLAAVRASRSRESWLIAIVLICAPLLHFVAKFIRGEIVILFITAPMVVVVAVTLVEELRKHFARRRKAL